MNIFCSRVINSDGSEDMEFLSSAPTKSFYEGLYEALHEGRIQGFVIREGNLNGGDSLVIHNSFI